MIVRLTESFVKTVNKIIVIKSIGDIDGSSCRFFNKSLVSLVPTFTWAMSLRIKTRLTGHLICNYTSRYDSFDLNAAHYSIDTVVTL